jgi:cold-inducible RNA-binding protein
MNIFVGNMSYETTEDEIREAFQAHGEVTSASIIMDRATGRSKGFGFVEMADPAQANAAIAALNLKEFHGRALTVNEARPRGAGGGSTSRENSNRHGW